MDYDLEYHKELERKVEMLYDNISTTTNATQKNKESIIKLHYKLNIITILILLTLALNIPQSIPYISTLFRFLLNVI